MKKFSRHELPFAYSMVAAAGRVKPRRDGQHPIDKFFLLWTAFSAIYTAAAKRRGVSTKLLHNPDGSVATYENGSVKIPEVEPVTDRQQIAETLLEFDEDLKTALIQHASVGFFADRFPFWQGKKIEQDAFGQRVNGVINISYTTSAEYPVWSPIDLEVYARYQAHPDNPADRDFLAKQIVELLYTIRENLVQIGNIFNEASDIAVFDHSLPLLELIVEAFLEEV